MRLAPLFWLALLSSQPAYPQEAPPPSPVAESSDGPDPNEQFVAADLDADGKAIVDGLNRFGLELYGKLRPAKDDLALSPASVSTAFGLAYAGARGRTADEIAATLHYPAIADFHRSFGGLLKTMDLSRNGRTLAVNNAIWLQDGMAVNGDYLGLVERSYGAGIRRIDYARDPQSARLAINAWVESKTNNRIRNLLQPIDVTAETRSVLVNTIYFKADWADPFAKSDTREEDFTLANGGKVRRDLMHQKGDFAFAEDKGVKALRMPYRGGETEMVVLLPDKASGLAALERSLDSRSVDGWLNKLDGGGRSRVDVTFPRFKVESRFRLVPILQQLGMKAPFSSQSDFSGMRPAAAPGAPFTIGTVVHQVFVEVEEKGTEAAAATAIGIIVTSARTGEPKLFRADHPFLFLIRDRRTDAILFIGRFTGETAS